MGRGGGFKGRLDELQNTDIDSREDCMISLADMCIQYLLERFLWEEGDGMNGECRGDGGCNPYCALKLVSNGELTTL